MAQSRKNPALASALVAVEQQARNQGPAAGVRQAEATGIGVRGEQVRVTIQAEGGNVDAARAAVTQVGGTVEASAGGRIDASVPTGGLAQLASAPGVEYVAPTRRLIPTAVKGQEVEASGATTWQTGGAAGAGVKIAVLDGDFLGYKERQASGDLPLGAITKDFCGSDGFENNLDGGHGTAVAEIVYETAPGAQLYLVCAGTLTQMSDAVDYMVAQGIKIVNHSRGIFNTSRADGAYSSSDPSFLPESLITKAYNGGIVWVNSAGNSGSTHWAGAFSDTDSDGVHNFTASDEGNNITVSNNGSVSIFLKWDSWPTTSEDFDLYLSRASDGPGGGVLGQRPERLGHADRGSELYEPDRCPAEPVHLDRALPIDKQPGDGPVHRGEHLDAAVHQLGRQPDRFRGLTPSAGRGGGVLAGQDDDRGVQLARPDHRRPHQARHHRLRQRLQRDVRRLHRLRYQRLLRHQRGGTERRRRRRAAEGRQPGMEP
jgi:hypothetical protein